MHSRLPSSRPTSRNALDSYAERPVSSQRRPFGPIDPPYMRERPLSVDSVEKLGFMEETTNLRSYESPENFPRGGSRHSCYLFT